MQKLRPNLRQILCNKNIGVFDIVYAVENPLLTETQEFSLLIKLYHFVVQLLPLVNNKVSLLLQINVDNILSLVKI